MQDYGRITVDTISIGGMGVICSAGNNISELYHNLYYSSDSLSHVKNNTSSYYVGKINGFNHSNNRHDKSFSLAKQAIKQALSSTKDRNIGFIYATSLGGILSAETYLNHYLKGKKAKQSLLLDYPVSSLAHHLAKLFKFEGIVSSFSCACTSSFSALGYAIEVLTSGIHDKILICAADTLSQQTIHGFKAIGASSHEPARPFDENRNGMNLGEAAAAVLLERNTDSTLTLRGYGNSNDAFHLTAPHPEGRGLKHAIDIAFSDSGLSVNDVDAIHLHGTGTKYNDAMELSLLEKIFASTGKKIPAFSTKTQTGHTLGPSGLLTLINSCLIIENQFIPGTLYFNQSEFKLEHLSITETVRHSTNVNTILIVSSGFTGHNSAVLINRC